MGGRVLYRQRLRIRKPAAAEFRRVGGEGGDIPLAGRYAYPVVFIIVGGEVHRAQQLVPYLIPPEEHHHVVVIVIRHQPLKALPVKINVPQGALRLVEGVGGLEERMELLIFLMLQ